MIFIRYITETDTKPICIIFPEILFKNLDILFVVFRDYVVLNNPYFYVIPGIANLRKCMEYHILFTHNPIIVAIIYMHR